LFSRVVARVSEVTGGGHGAKFKCKKDEAIAGLVACPTVVEASLLEQPTIERLLSMLGFPVTLRVTRLAQE
jgi:hypothetical protein